MEQIDASGLKCIYFMFVYFNFVNENCINQAAVTARSYIFSCLKRNVFFTVMLYNEVSIRRCLALARKSYFIPCVVEQDLLWRRGQKWAAGNIL